jgi:hypothetical protein
MQKVNMDDGEYSARKYDVRVDLVSVFFELLDY